MTIIDRIYRFFAPRRRLLFAMTLILVTAGLVGSRGIRLEENIAALLPDGRSEVAEDFALLEQAPFARKVIISLAAAPGTDPAVFGEAAEELKAALTPPWFSRAAAGPADLAEGAILPWLTGNLPNLVSAGELAPFAAGLDSPAVEERLREVKEQLLLPEGWALKEVLRRDPLGLHRLGLEKLRHLNLVPQARLDDGRFLSADGRHALVIADTPVAVTDSAGSAAMLRAVETALATLPPSVTATVVSGHRYAAANAGGIRRDLTVTLTASTLGLVAIFAAFLRCWRAIFPFLVPVSVLCLAASTIGLLYGRVSAITIGFGAVLLGISVDFALHVYFALRRGGAGAAEITARVAKPVLFGGLTTVGAFAVLLASDLPGQRQLAVFTITGLILSLLLSLLVLPQLVPPSPTASADSRPPAAANGRFRRFTAFRPPRRVVIGVWAAVLLLALIPASQLRIDGDLRRLSLVPAELQAAEGELQAVWGNLRGKALVFAHGNDLAAATEANERLFAFLQQHRPGEAVSLAPLLPSPAIQERNRQQWLAFWGNGEGKRLASDLQAAAGRLGFAPRAFAPFLEQLAKSPPPVDPEGLRGAGLGEAVDALILPMEAEVRLLTLVPDSPATVGLFSRHEQELPGIRLVSQSRFGENLSRAIGRDFARFLVGAALLVTLLVAVLFRRPRPVLLALLPVVTGLICMFGFMGAAGIDFTLLNVVAAVLVIGLGVDYGIFMVCRMAEEYDHATERAVLVSGLTTVAGFGALVLARHPALHSIGITVLLGISTAIPAALLVIPAFYRRGE